MTRHRPLDTLTDLARTRTDDAAGRLAALLNAQTGASEKLQLLLRYREDYQAHLQSRLAEGLPGTHWHNHQAFIRTLSGAIEQQRAIVDQAGHRVAHGRDDWQRQQRRLHALDTLGERERSQWRLHQGRREQRDSDEQAARGLLARSARAAS